MESRGKNGWMLWFIVGVGNRGRLEMVQTSTVFSLGGRMRVKGDEEVPTMGGVGIEWRSCGYRTGASIVPV